MANTIEFNKKCTPASEYVVLRVIERNDIVQMGHILIAESEFANEKLAFGQIVDIGKKASEEYALQKGDYVIYDRLATAHQTAPIAVTKYVNIIAKTDATNTEFFPLRNMVFVQDDTETVQMVGKVLVDNYNKKLRLGKVVAMNIDTDIEVPLQLVIQ